MKLKYKEVKLVILTSFSMKNIWNDVAIFPIVY